MKKCKACRWVGFCFPNRKLYGLVQGFYAGSAAKAKPVDPEVGCGWFDKEVKS